MTREEILQLEPGSKIDRLVAEKVMGWTFNEDWCEWVDERGHSKGWQEDWNPSTDIAAAWEVVKVLVSHGWHFELRTTEITASGSLLWRVSFWRCGGSEGFCLAADVPLAICRTALLVMMEGGK